MPRECSASDTATRVPKVLDPYNLSRGYAKVTVVSGSGVMALASVVDNVTNDPTTVRMVRL